MKRFWFVVFPLTICSAACFPASAGVVLNVPSEIVPIPSSATDLALDLTFSLTAPTVGQSLVGYDLYLTLAGGSGGGLTITGVGTGSDRPANSVLSSDPAFAVQTGPAGEVLYSFGDASLTGAGTIADGSALLQVELQLQPGASGTYQIDPFVDAAGEPTTQFFSALDDGGNPVPITAVTFQAGTVSVALPGDANLDGKVDVNDLTIVLSNFGQSGVTWRQGDFNNDGKVDVNDLTIVLSNFGSSLGTGNVAAAPSRQRPHCWRPVCRRLAGLHLAAGPVIRCVSLGGAPTYLTTATSAAGWHVPERSEGRGCRGNHALRCVRDVPPSSDRLLLTRQLSLGPSPRRKPQS